MCGMLNHHRLLSGVLRNSGVGETPSDAVTLPLFVNFDSDTVGQAPAGWVDNGSGFAPIVANSLDGQNSYNPNRKCLHIRNDADDHCDTQYDFGISLQTSFRLAVWANCESTSGEDFQRIALHDAAKNMWFYNKFSYINNHWQNSTKVNGVDNVWVLQDNTLTSPSGYRWRRITIEYNASTEEITCQMYYMDSPSTQGYSAVLDFSGESAWNHVALDTMRFWSIDESSVYTKDQYVLGFWVGKLTDAWPAVVMP